MPGGEITLTVEFQTWLGSGNNQPVSGVQLTIAPVAGGSPVVGPTSSVTEIDRVTSSYQSLPPESTTRDYVATWTSTSPAWTIRQVVTVVRCRRRHRHLACMPRSRSTGSRSTTSWGVRDHRRAAAGPVRRAAAADPLHDLRHGAHARGRCRHEGKPGDAAARELLDHRRHVHHGAGGVAVGAGRGMSSVMPRLRSIAGRRMTGAPAWPRHPDSRESIAWP